MIKVEVPQEVETLTWLDRELGNPVPLKGFCSIGREDGNDILLDSLAVSRRHAIIHEKDNAYWLVDLGSNNGSRVNGRKVSQPVRLRAGDYIQIPTAVFTFRQAFIPKPVSIPSENIEETPQQTVTPPKPAAVRPEKKKAPPLATVTLPLLGPTPTRNESPKPSIIVLPPVLAPRLEMKLHPATVIEPRPATAMREKKKEPGPTPENLPVPLVAATPTKKRASRAAIIILAPITEQPEDATKLHPATVILPRPTTTRPEKKKKPLPSSIVILPPVIAQSEETTKLHPATVILPKPVTASLEKQKEPPRGIATELDLFPTQTLNAKEPTPATPIMPTPEPEPAQALVTSKLVESNKPDSEIATDFAPVSDPVSTQFEESEEPSLDIPAMPPALPQGWENSQPEPEIPAFATTGPEHECLTAKRSMYVGLASIFLPFLGVIPALAAIIMGHTALRTIKRSGGALAGRDYAIKGLFFGYVTLAIILTYSSIFYALYSSPSHSALIAHAQTTPPLEPLIITPGNQNALRTPTSSVIANSLNNQGLPPSTDPSGGDQTPSPPPPVTIAETQNVQDQTSPANASPIHDATSEAASGQTSAPSPGALPPVALDASRDKSGLNSESSNSEQPGPTAPESRPAAVYSAEEQSRLKNEMLSLPMPATSLDSPDYMDAQAFNDSARILARPPEAKYAESVQEFIDGVRTRNPDQKRLVILSAMYDNYTAAMAKP